MDDIHTENVKERDAERCWQCLSLVGTVRKTKDEWLPVDVLK